MNMFLMILLFLGPLVLFGLVKMGVNLIIPLFICVVAADVGIGLFVWGMSTTNLAQHHDGDMLPRAVYGMLIFISAAFGGVLLGVVVLARWLSGEYQGVKEGHKT